MRTGNAVLVAGPPASGKSFLLKANHGVINLVPNCFEGLEPNLQHWQIVHAGQVKSDHLNDHVIVHYDFLKQWKRNPGEWCYHRDATLDFLGHMQVVAIVTVFASQSILMERLKRRIIQLALQSIRHPLSAPSCLRELLVLKRLLRLYGLVDSFFLYRRWFDFCAGFTVPHFVIENDSQPQPPVALPQWYGSHMIS